MLSLEIRIVLAILACYRIAQYIPFDEGPGGIFSALRSGVGRKAGMEGGLWYWLAEFLRCVFCEGVWIALGLVPAILIPTIIGDIFLLWQGIAGGQAFLQSLTMPRDGED